MDAFWTPASRREWRVGQEDKIFLGLAICRVGEIAFGTEWSGRSDRPYRDQLKVCQNYLVEQLCSGNVQAYAFREGTRQYVSIHHEYWLSKTLANQTIWNCRVIPKELSFDLHERSLVFVDRVMFENLKIPTYKLEPILPSARSGIDYLDFLIESAAELDIGSEVYDLHELKNWLAGRMLLKLDGFETERDSKTTLEDAKNNGGRTREAIIKSMAYILRGSDVFGNVGRKRGNAKDPKDWRKDWLDIPVEPAEDFE